jgi:hypothetical protein
VARALVLPSRIPEPDHEQVERGSLRASAALRERCDSKEQTGGDANAGRAGRLTLDGPRVAGGVGV